MGLLIEHVGPDGVRATCRGSGAVYAVTWTRAEGWPCTCPAYRTCAHVLALQAVTVRPECFTGG
jgi:hypothetical protein